MSSTYTGDPTATQAPSPAPARGVEPIVTLPTDGDAGNAASVMQAFKVLADYCAWLNNHAAILDDAGPNNFTNSLAWATAALADGDHRLGFGSPSDDRQKVAVFQQGPAVGAQFAYLYQEKETAGGGLSLVVNAVWNQAGPTWVRTTAAASPAMIFRVRGSEIRIGYVDGTSASWADTAWTGDAGLIPYAPAAGAPGNGLQSEGPLLIARSVGAAAWPTVQVTAGELFRDFIPLGYYRALWTVAPAETVRCCSNVKSVTRTGAGQYYVIFWPVVADPTIARVSYNLISPAGGGPTGGRRIGCTVQDAGGGDAGRVRVNVSIWDETAPGYAGPFPLAASPLVVTNVDDEFEIEVKCKP